MVGQHYDDHYAFWTQCHHSFTNAASVPIQTTLFKFRANSYMNIRPIFTRRSIPNMTPIFLNQYVNYFLLLGKGNSN
jgi:hypothetical protein